MEAALPRQGLGEGHEPRPLYKYKKAANSAFHNKNSTMQKNATNGKSNMPVGILKTPLWLLIRFYQVAISPVLHLFPGAGCRFYPTCSQYAIEAISRHGAFKGCLMAACRIRRCQPLCKGGLDYVPKKFSFRGLLKQNKVDENSDSDT